MLTGHFFLQLYHKGNIISEKWEQKLITGFIHCWIMWWDVDIWGFVGTKAGKIEYYIEKDVKAQKQLKCQFILNDAC